MSTGGSRMAFQGFATLHYGAFAHKLCVCRNVGVSTENAVAATRAGRKRRVRVPRMVSAERAEPVVLMEKNRGELPGTVRVRFAPSPTGTLHVGGARTALYNWLIAQKQTGDGRFIVRVEDTDLARSTRESEQAVLKDLTWLGLQWDEGPDMPDAPCAPYRQSERGEIYRKFAQQLLDSGAAYRCFCTEEELEAKRAAAEAEGRDVKYDGTWRDADPKEMQRRLDAGETYTVRFRVPEGARVEINDLVRGHVAWDAEATVGDFILLRSTGVPVYNFCVAIDDALMGITTVVRAEEHLTNTVRQVLILQALDCRVPQYAHCSLILGEDRSKLSKRHGATSVDQFRQQGFLPDAMINYLALCGWNEGTDTEIYSRAELIKSFDPTRITKSPAVFDMAKLRWVNGQHLRQLDHNTLAASLARALAEEGVLEGGELAGTQSLAVMTELFREAMELTMDGATLLRNSCAHPLNATIASGEVDAIINAEGGKFDLLRDAIVAAYDDGSFAGGSLDVLDAHAFEDAWKKWVKELGKALGLKGKALFQPLRLCLTGSMAGRDVGGVVRLIFVMEKEGFKMNGFVGLGERIETLRKMNN